MTRWRTRHRGVTGDRGAAAVEFAIVLVVLLLIIFAIIDFGRLFFAVQGAKSASREGARTAVIATNDESAVFLAMDNAMGGGSALAGGGEPTFYWAHDLNPVVPLNEMSPLPDTIMSGAGNQCSGAESITVQVVQPFRWFTPVGIFAGGVDDVRADTTMRCE
jgi:Flp pilus assembly protein TadG